MSLTEQTERGGSQFRDGGSSDDGGHRGRSSQPVEEEGVEVVLDSKVTKVMDSSEGHRKKAPPGQNVFREHPTSSHAVRPRAVRPPSGGGSFAPPRGDYPPHPATVPYNPSGSFEEGAYYQHPHAPHHHSPQVQYPSHGGRYPVDDVNVISPSHGKGDGQHNRPPRVSQRGGHHGQYYQYPPTSPMSRPGAPASKRPDAPYSNAMQGGQPYGHPEDGTWNSYPPATSNGEHRSRPPLVAESSFDSDPYASSQYGSHPPTPANQPYAPGAPPTPTSMPLFDPSQQFYGGGGSWGSFDSAGPPGPPPPQFDDQRFYGYPPNSPYPPPYSPGAPAYAYGDPYATPYPNYGPPPHSGSYDEAEHGFLRDYHPDQDGHLQNPHHPATVTPGDNRKGSGPSPQTDSTPVTNNRSESGMLLPNAAYEVDFEVTNPPKEPVIPPSVHPVCITPSEVNEDDVLCGRGGGTNSQIGNRRFRKLVQDFQPTYLLARRKEKPLLARTIVLIIRKRGGRFLKKNDDTGELFEVGDAKAEAKTSQALREGLDVRATKSAANSLMDKNKKKKKGKGKDKGKEDAKEKEVQEKAPDVKSEPTADSTTGPSKNLSEKRDKTPPPDLPALKGGEGMSGLVHPHSPEALSFRKRRRMRSGDSLLSMQDKFFPDFCPPRADLCRTSSPNPDGPTAMNTATTPPARNSSIQDDDDVQPGGCQPGCANIAMDIVMGAASGGFCLGPKWRSSN